VLVRACVWGYSTHSELNDAGKHCSWSAQTSSEAHPPTNTCDSERTTSYTRAKKRSHNAKKNAYPQPTVGLQHIRLNRKGRRSESPRNTRRIVFLRFKSARTQISRGRAASGVSPGAAARPLDRTRVMWIVARGECHGARHSEEGSPLFTLSSLALVRSSGRLRG